MTVPAVVMELGLAAFNTVNVALGGTVTVADEGGEVTAGPVGGVPDTVAVSLMDPLSMSVWVVL